MTQTGTNPGKSKKKSAKRTKPVELANVKLDGHIDKLAKNLKVPVTGKTIKQLAAITKYVVDRMTVYSNECIVDYAKGQTLNAPAIKTGLSAMLPTGMREPVISAGDKACAMLVREEEPAEAAEPAAVAAA